MTAKILQFPDLINKREQNIIDTDLEFILGALEIIMHGTDYEELLIIGVNKENDIEVVHTEGNDRSVEILDRAVVEQFLGEED